MKLDQYCYILNPRIMSCADHKGKTKAQFDFLINEVEVAEKSRDEVANTATPIIQAMYLCNSGTSSLDVVEIFDRLRTAPDVYFNNIKEAGNMGASMALAMTESLYPKIDIDSIDGFAIGTSEEDALDLINDAQKAADKIAVDVLDRFQSSNISPASSGDGKDDFEE